MVAVIGCWWVWPGGHPGRLFIVAASRILAIDPVEMKRKTAVFAVRRDRSSARPPRWPPGRRRR